MAGTVQGFCDPKFAIVKEEFERNFAEREEVGASVCLSLNDGSVLLNLVNPHPLCTQDGLLYSTHMHRGNIEGVHVYVFAARIPKMLQTRMPRQT